MERTASRPALGDSVPESVAHPRMGVRLVGLLAIGLGVGSFLLANAAYGALPAGAVATGPATWVELFVLLPTLLSIAGVAAVVGLVLLTR